MPPPIVFRNTYRTGAELESEIEARQAQNPESLRGVHEQVIKLVDNMVQNYLGNVRRTIQRITNFVDNQRATLGNSTTVQQPRESPADNSVVQQQSVSGQVMQGFSNIRQSILTRIQSLSKRMHDFTMQWTKAIGKQQSPLLDRLPSRGVELWRDFWDTMRKQVRRINQEISQIATDMSRLVNIRVPSVSGLTGTGPQMNRDESLLYFDSLPAKTNQVAQQLEEFYQKMSATLLAEQNKLNPFNRLAHTDNGLNKKVDQANIYDESDDEATKRELNNNAALRQQIHQEISVFGSIFDIMTTFIQRLRESATNTIRDVVQPGAVNNNNNDPVTPGPSIKPQVDKLLGETINSQRNINSQGKPTLLPKNRD